MTSAAVREPRLADAPDEELAGPVPPQDFHAEQCVLGGMLLSKDAIADVLEIVKPGDFYQPRHELVWSAVLDLYSRGEPADAVLVAAELERTGRLARAGGAPYLHTLISSTPTAANAAHYARIVRERAVKRRLVEAGVRIAQRSSDPSSGESVELMDWAQQELDRAASHSTSGDAETIGGLMGSTFDELDELASNKGRLRGVPSGYPDLDRATNGFQPGQLVIVAARPGLGKSTLAVSFLRAASIAHGKTGVLFSLEMSKGELMMRILAAEAEVKLADMLAGRMGDKDWERLARRMGQIESAPLLIDDSPNLTLMEIRAKARRLKQRRGLDLVVVDYLQLLTAGKRVENRQAEVSEFSRQLKLLAKELEVPVVALSQLNRNAESRTDKRPHLSDLRESGSLEQDADMVILLHRPGGDDPDDPRAGEVELILAKNRSGPTHSGITAIDRLHKARLDPVPRG